MMSNWVFIGPLIYWDTPKTKTKNDEVKLWELNTHTHTHTHIYICIYNFLDLSLTNHLFVGTPSIIRWNLEYGNLIRDFGRLSSDKDML